MHWSLLYAGLTVGTVGIAMTSERRGASVHGPLVASCILVVTWVVSNLSVWFAPLHRDLFFPMMDVACSVLFFSWWRQHGGWWLAVLSVLFSVEVILHSTFRLGLVDRYAYAIWLNLAYAAQLSCVVLESFHFMLQKRD